MRCMQKATTREKVFAALSFSVGLLVPLLLTLFFTEYYSLGLKLGTVVYWVAVAVMMGFNLHPKGPKRFDTLVRQATDSRLVSALLKGLVGFFLLAALALLCIPIALLVMYWG